MECDFFSAVIDGNEVYIPTDDFLSESEKVSRSFCKNHLSSDDVIRVRKRSMAIRDEYLLKLMSQCKSKDAGKLVPEKKMDGGIKTYDHRNAESVKSIIDYLLKN